MKLSELFEGAPGDVNTVAILKRIIDAARDVNGAEVVTSDTSVTARPPVETHPGEESNYSDLDFTCSYDFPESIPTVGDLKKAVPAAYYKKAIIKITREKKAGFTSYGRFEIYTVHPLSTSDVKELKKYLK